jgi:HEAT repeat protein
LKQVADKRVDEPGRPCALDAFAAREKEPDASVRALALLTAVEHREAPGAVDATFIAGLEDPVPAVRVCAALSLSRLGPRAREALPSLRACAASDASRLVREAAAMTAALIAKQ